MPDPALLAWLEEQVNQTADGRYWHRMLRERAEARVAALAVLKPIVDAAHDDARRYLRAAFGDTLDPIDEPVSQDAAAAYPGLLPFQTLYGYFGEIVAGVVAEHFAPFGLGPWVVPAYLFRFHVVAFQELERIRQGGDPTSALPGRTGDDC